MRKGTIFPIEATKAPAASKRRSLGACPISTVSEDVIAERGRGTFPQMFMELGRSARMRTFVRPTRCPETSPQPGRRRGCAVDGASPSHRALTSAPQCGESRPPEDHDVGTGRRPVASAVRRRHRHRDCRGFIKWVPSVTLVSISELALRTVDRRRAEHARHLGPFCLTFSKSAVRLQHFQCVRSTCRSLFKTIVSAA